MIQAIETIYKGYKFRSRLEARWAVWFDSLGIQWEYEKEGYQLRSGWYLPDFWLPQFNAWFEIKGETIDYSHGDWQKCRDLADAHCPVLLAQGNIGEESITLFAHDVTESGTAGSGEYEGYWAFGAQDIIFATPYLYRRSIDDCNWETLTWVHESGKPHHYLLQLAYRAARSARFEHGEKP